METKHYNYILLEFPGFTECSIIDSDKHLLNGEVQFEKVLDDLAAYYKRSIKNEDFKTVRAISGVLEYLIYENNDFEESIVDHFLNVFDRDSLDYSLQKKYMPSRLRDISDILLKDQSLQKKYYDEILQKFPDFLDNPNIFSDSHIINYEIQLNLIFSGLGAYFRTAVDLDNKVLVERLNDMVMAWMKKDEQGIKNEILTGYLESFLPSDKNFDKYKKALPRKLRKWV